MQLNIGGSPILNRDSKRQWIFLPISLVPEIFYFILHFEVKKKMRNVLKDADIFGLFVVTEQDD